MRLSNIFKTNVRHKNSYISALDGIRGIAVLIVILSHSSNAGFISTPYLDFSGFGQYGVMLFFFLSAFLLSRPYFNSDNQIINAKDGIIYINTSELFSYSLRRLLRIMPLYYTVLLFDFYFINFYFKNQNDYTLLMDHLLFQKGISVFWSIPVEMTFYLVLPIVVFLLITLSKTVNRLYFLTFILILWSLLMLLFDLSNSFLQTMGIHFYVPLFIFGIFTSLLYAKSTEFSKEFSKKVKFFLECIAILCIFIIIIRIPHIWFNFRGQDFNYIKSVGIPIDFFRTNIVLLGIVTSVFTYCFLNGLGYIKKFLSFGLLRHIGKISFSMYLIHPPVIFFVLNLEDIPYALKAILVFIITFVIANITFVVIEKPFLNILFKYKKIQVKHDVNVGSTISK